MKWKLKKRRINIKEYTDLFQSDWTLTLLKNYSRQNNYFSCSSASLAIVLNSAMCEPHRRISESTVVNRSFNSRFKKRIGYEGDNETHGVNLSELEALSKLVFKSLSKLEIETKVFRVTGKLSKKTVKKNLERLSTRSFMIANFISNFGIGHFSPVAGYDPINEIVLILDTFHPEPYMISLDTFIQGMATKDSQIYRGFLMIEIME